MKVQCEQIQEAIKIAKARAGFLKAKNQAKKAVLKYGNNFTSYSSKENATVNSYRKEARSNSQKNQGWIIACEYKNINQNTPELKEKNLHNWVKTVTKDCAKKIRNLNHHILEGNILEIEKITGHSSVQEVCQYIDKLVKDIEKLASYFKLFGEIAAVYGAFKMIVEDFKVSGFYQKKRKKTYNNYSYNKDYNYQKALSRKDFPIFSSCHSLKEGKELKKKLSMENHPDLGGCEEEMKVINHQFDLFIRWIEKE